MVLGLFCSTACDPLDDINAEIDQQEAPVVGDTAYTLTDDDYDFENFDLYGTDFGSKEEAKEKLPEFLDDLYSFWGKGSSVLVGYNLYIGSAFSAKDYNLNQDDYTSTGSDLLGFQADAVPSEYLADILADNVSYAKEGDYRVAKYFQYTGSAYTVTPTVILDENFDYGTTEGDLLTLSTDWAAHSSAGYNPMQYAPTSLSMTDYPKSDIGGSLALNISLGNEDVNSSFSEITSGKVYSSVLVNFSAVTDYTKSYFFHFMETDSYSYAARVGAMTDGNGGILFGIGASSKNLVYTETAYDLNTTYLLVASYDINAGVSNLYVLTTVASEEPSAPDATNTDGAGLAVQKIAVRQGGVGTATIDGIRVANTWSAIMTNDVLEDETVGNKDSFEMNFTYNGESWESPSDKFYFISEADFASMSLETFGSGADPVAFPEDYLPTFLGLKFPYAQEGDALDVAYNYVSSSSGLGVRGNLYTVIDGEWVGYESTINTTLQFGHNGVTWVPDNTIKYTLTAADYVYMADELTGNTDYSNVSLPNLAGYSDFDYNWKENQIIEALGILADNLNPSAVEGQKYLFTYLLYDSGINELSMRLVKESGVWVLFD